MTLIVAVPGSVNGALDSLTAIEPLIEHALETLGGHTSHATGSDATGSHAAGPAGSG